MLKLFPMVGAIAAAAVFSQAPAFSQQYLQRLAGQVDALSEVVVDFDKSALAAGLGREEALQQMTGTDFLAARQTDMRATFARHTRLADSLSAIRAATPMQRLAMPHRFTDRDVAKAALSDFSPALPLTSAGAVAAGAGAITGWVVFGMVLSILALPFRASQRKLNRLRNSPIDHTRREPALRKLASDVPTLRGETKWQKPSSHGVAGTDMNPNKLPGFLTRS